MGLLLRVAVLHVSCLSVSPLHTLHVWADCGAGDITGLHLVVCYQAMGERQKQRDAFEKLLQVPFSMDKEDHYKDLEVCTRT